MKYNLISIDKLMNEDVFFNAAWIRRVFLVVVGLCVSLWLIYFGAEPPSLITPGREEDRMHRVGGGTLGRGPYPTRHQIRHQAMKRWTGEWGKETVSPLWGLSFPASHFVSCCWRLRHTEHKKKLLCYFSHGFKSLWKCQHPYTAHGNTYFHSRSGPPCGQLCSLPWSL